MRGAALGGSPARQPPACAATAAAPASAATADVSAPAAASSAAMPLQPSAFAAAAAQAAPLSPMASSGTPASLVAVASPTADAAAVDAPLTAPASDAAADDALAAVLAEPLPEAPAAAPPPAAAGGGGAAGQTFSAVQPAASAGASPTSPLQQPALPGAVGRSPARREGSLKHWIDEQAPQANPPADAQAVVAGPPPMQPQT